MQAVEAPYIDFQRLRGVRDFGLEGCSSLPVLMREVHFNQGHFPYGIVALNQADPSDMVGYATFYTYPGDNQLIDLEPSFMELRNLHVDPELRKRGVGSALLDYARDFARSRRRVLILKPERPGEMTGAEFRDREYPMTTEQLREMYLRHGFRAFTEQEQEFYVRELVDRDFTCSLWFDGLDIDSHQFSDEISHERVMHGMGKEERLLLAHLTLEEKDALIRQHSRTRYHSEQGIDQRWRLAREKMDAYLVEDDPTFSS